MDEIMKRFLKMGLLGKIRSDDLHGECKRLGAGGAVWSDRNAVAGWDHQMIFCR